MSAVSTFTNDSVRKSIPTGTNSRCLRKRFEDWPSPSRHPESHSCGTEELGRENVKVTSSGSLDPARDDRKDLPRFGQLAFFFVGRRFFHRLIEQLCIIASFAILPRAFVVGVTGNQRERDRRFRVNHLLGALIDFAPRVRLLQRGTAEGAVTHVPHRDLHSVFVHPDRETKIIAGHYRVLREILRDTAADHEQSALFGGDFNFCQLKKILGRIDTEMLVRIFVLMMNQTEAAAAVAESRAKDRYV